MVSQAAAQTSQGRLEPKVHGICLILCSIRGVLWPENMLLIAVTSLLPLCSQVRHFGPVASDSLLFQMALLVQIV